MCNMNVCLCMTVHCPKLQLRSVHTATNVNRTFSLQFLFIAIADGFAFLQCKQIIRRFNSFCAMYSVSAKLDIKNNLGEIYGWFAFMRTLCFRQINHTPKGTSGKFLVFTKTKFTFTSPYRLSCNASGWGHPSGVPFSVCCSGEIIYCKTHSSCVVTWQPGAQKSGDARGSVPKHVLFVKRVGWKR